MLQEGTDFDLDERVLQEGDQELDGNPSRTYSGEERVFCLRQIDLCRKNRNFQSSRSV